MNPSATLGKFRWQALITLDLNVAGAGAGSGSGGGVYATNGAVVNFLGSSSKPASLTKNRADYGGGLFLTGAASAAEFRDAEIVENAGLLGGGGVAVATHPSPAAHPPTSRHAERPVSLGSLVLACSSTSSSDRHRCRQGVSGHELRTRS